MSARFVNTNIRIEPTQLAELQALNKRTRVPWSVYVREGIALVLEKYREGPPASSSASSAAPTPSAPEKETSKP